MTSTDVTNADAATKNVTMPQMARVLPQLFDTWSMVIDQTPGSLFLARLLMPMGMKVYNQVGTSVALPETLRGLAMWELREASTGTAKLTSEAEGASYSIRFTGQDGIVVSDPGAWSWGGLASMTGEADGPPLSPGTPLASYCAALHAAIAILATRQAGFSHFELSIGLGDVVASLIEIAGLKYATEGAIRGRAGDSWGLAGWGVYACKDGAIAVALRDREQLIALGSVLGMEQLASDDYADFTWGFCERVDEVHALITAGFGEYEASRAERELMALRIAAAKVLSSLAELLDDQHLNARGAIEPMGDGRIPALPYLVSGLMGRGVRPIRHESASSTDRPLAGIRVLDMSSVWAGPMAARILADLGADVVKVTRPGVQVGQYSSGAEWDRDFYAILNDRNKEVFEVDLRNPGDRSWLREQIQRSDVLIENMALGSLERAGFGHGVMHQLNGQLIIVAMPAHGLVGPRAAAVGYGTTIEQAAGLGWLYADDDHQPHRSGINFSDPIAGLYAAIGALVGLLSDRQKCVIELSQQEASLMLMTSALWSFEHDHTVPRPVTSHSDGRAGWVTAGPLGFVPVRDVSGVVGVPEAPGSACIRWVTHPDGRDYPLVALPWNGAFEQGVKLRPAEMPRLPRDAAADAKKERLMSPGIPDRPGISARRGTR